MKQILVQVGALLFATVLPPVWAQQAQQQQDSPDLRVQQLRQSRWAFDPTAFGPQSSKLIRDEKPNLRGILTYMYRVPELGLILVARSDVGEEPSLASERANAVKRFLVAESKRDHHAISVDRILIRADVGPCWQERHAKAPARVLLLAFLTTDAERGPDWAIRTCEEYADFNDEPPN